MSVADSHQAPSQPRVIFDGDCGICQKAVEWIRAQRGSENLELTAYQSLVGSGELSALGLTEKDCEESMQVVTGEGGVLSGADGFAHIFKQLSSYRSLGWVLALPPALWIARPAYRLFAKNRHRFGSVCSLPRE
jgi:predicted DCC family thiol-disulfide oxidoreductase YuxK